MADIIQIRRDTAANWASVNPVLAQGEMGLETDTERMKLGDGVTAYNSLNYFVTSQTNVGITGGTIDGTVIGGSSAAAGSFTSLTSTGIDVTGSVVSDGLTVDGDSTVDAITYTANSSFPTTGVSLNSNGFSYEMAGTQGKIFRSASNTKALMQITNDGDISFYEDTGTTAKFFWDAAAESLNVGSTQLNFSTVKVQTGSATDAAAGFNVFTSATGDGYLLFSDGNVGNQSYSGQVRYNHASDFMAFGTAGGVERMRINSTGIDVTGNVTADSAKVENGTTSTVTISESTGSGTAELRFVATESFPKTKIVTDVSAGSLSLETLGNERLNIANNGNISFYEDTGTTAKLFWDAAAESLLIGQTSIPTGLGASNTKLILGNFEDAPEFVAYNSDNVLEAGDKIGAYLFGNDDNNATEDHFAGMWAKSSGSTGAMDIHFAAGKVNYEDDSPHMTLDFNGNVGIGTSSPTSYGHSLVIAKDAAGGATYATITNTNANQFLNLGINADVAEITWDNGDSLAFGTTAASTDEGQTLEAMRINASGNVGIGTSSPSYLLTTNYNANATFSNAGSDFAQMWQNSDTNALGVALADDATARFVTNNGYEIAFNNATTEAMRIDASGNVGIGTSSPACGLDISNSGNGSVGDQARITSTDTDSKLAFVNTGGNGAITQSSGAMRFMTNTANTERMRIDASGNLLVSGTSTTPWGNATGTTADNQFIAREDGIMGATAYKSTTNVGYVGYFNRTATDGGILAFNKNGTTVGSIGNSDANTIYIQGGNAFWGATLTSPQSAGNGLRLIDNGDSVRKFSPTLDNTYDLGGSGSTDRFKDLYLSGGVVFGTTGGNVTGATLDDYEEGTWTPTYGGTTTIGTGTYSFQYGSYTKVGNVVTVNGYFRSISHTGTGNIQLRDLPFTVASGNNNYAVLTIGESFNLTKSTDTVIGGYAIPNTDRVQLRQMYTDTATTSTTNVVMDTAFDLLFTVTYRTA